MSDGVDLGGYKNYNIIYKFDKVYKNSITSKANVKINS